MKTKTWKVITSTGKQADLEAGIEKKEIQKPMHISASEFIRWLALRATLTMRLCGRYFSDEAAPAEEPELHSGSFSRVLIVVTQGEGTSADPN